MFKFEDITREPTSMGLEQPVAAMLAYMFGWVSGLVFFFVEKRNRYVRFAAMQSIILGAAWFTVWLTLFILTFIPWIGILFGILNALVAIGMVVLLVFLIVFGFQDKKMILPVIGEMAERIASRRG
jgi:uncharacterized membrane protein